jgi:hypothetical protein
MTMTHETDKYWFSGPSGWKDNSHPISWQGWLVVAVYALLMTGSALLLAKRVPAGFAAIAMIVTAVFLTICHAKTQGGLSLRLPPGLGGPAPKPQKQPRRSRRRQ